MPEENQNRLSNECIRLLTIADLHYHHYIQHPVLFTQLHVDADNDFAQGLKKFLGNVPQERTPNNGKIVSILEKLHLVDVTKIKHHDFYNVGSLEYGEFQITDLGDKFLKSQIPTKKLARTYKTGENCYHNLHLNNFIRIVCILILIGLLIHGLVNPFLMFFAIAMVVIIAYTIIRSILVRYCNRKIINNYSMSKPHFADFFKHNTNATDSQEDSEILNSDSASMLFNKKPLSQRPPVFH